MNSKTCSALFSRACFVFRPGSRTRSNIFAIFVLIALLAVSTINPARAESSDPLVAINRPVHEFNSVVDSLVFKPIASIYRALVPRVVKKGISNILSNLDDVAVTVNDLLQGDIAQASRDLGRVVVNSTVGIGGLFDVADPLFELEKNDDDFGKTLAHWGVDRGPYIVLPLLGPSTVREGFGGIGNLLLNPGFNTSESSVRDKFIALGGINARAELLVFDDLIMGDEYLFIRELYLQNLDYQEGTENPLITFEEF